MRQITGVAFIRVQMDLQLGAGVHATQQILQNHRTRAFHAQIKPIANLFASNREADLVMLGGYVYPKTGVALGPLTVQMMRDIHVRKAVLSVGGITAKGLFNSNMLLVETEQQMMRCADEVVVVADHTKISRQALAFLCELSAIHTLVVDAGLTRTQKEMIERARVKLIQAGENQPSDQSEPVLRDRK